MQNIEELEKSVQDYEHLLTAAKKRLEEEKKKVEIEVGDYIVALKGSMFGDDGECVSKGKIYKVTQVGNSNFRFLNNFNKNDSWGKEKFRKATLVEIEAHLRERATQAGFVIGAKVKWKDSSPSSSWIINSIDFFETEKEFNDKASYANVSSKYILAARGDGNSAAICDKLILIKDEIEVNGYKAEYFDKYIKFGCAYRDWETLA